MQEVRLELHHASAREQKARIVGNQRRRRHALAALLLKELQVLLANFRCSHVLHWTGLALIFRTNAGPKAPIISNWPMIANARARVTPDLATSREFYELPWKMREIAAPRALRDSLCADTTRNVLS